MYILEAFDKELYERDLKQNAFDEGFKEGFKDGFKIGLLESLKAEEKEFYTSRIRIKLDKGMNIQQIAHDLETTVEVIEVLMQELDK